MLCSIIIIAVFFSKKRREKKQAYSSSVSEPKAVVSKLTREYNGIIV